MRLPAVFGLSLSACAASPPLDLPTAPTGPLEDLAFLSGRWITTGEGPRMEEIWGVPTGDSMVGVSALRVEGVNALVEVFTIEQRGDEVVLVLRHFEPGLVPWAAESAPDAALVYRLAERSEGRVAFRDPTRTEHDRLVYRLVDDRLEVRLESSDGTPPLIFDFER